MGKSNTQLSLRPLQANEEEWKESADELSFDDLSCMVSKALNDKCAGSNCMYWVYKLWPDKVVAKRSYGYDSTNPLFQLFSYTVSKDEDGGYKVTLGDPTEVMQMFVPADSAPDDALLAVREADKLCSDDPVFIESIMDDEEEDEEEIEEEQDPILKVASDAGLIEPLKESVGMNLKETFQQDYFDCPLTEAKVDVIMEGKSKRYVIRNVAMLSEHSKNGRKYSGKVQEEAVPIFEGIKAYADHPTKANENEPRRVKETIGRFKNVKFVPHLVKTFGDLYLAPTKLVTEYIIPIAQSDPTLIGSSINAYGRMDSAGNVEKITKGSSVDFVTEPATTKSLYEAHIEEPKEKGEKKMTLDEVLADKVIMEAVRDKIMEELDVVAAVEQKDEKIKEQDEKLKALEEEVAKMKLVESTRNTQAEIEKLLSESKLPDEAKDEVRSLLAKSGSTEERKALIGRMEAVFESVAKKIPEKPAPSVHTERKTGSSTVSDVDLAKRVFESFQARK